MTQTTVTRMHSALTQRGVTPALATLATLEMGSPVQVSLILLTVLCTYLSPIIQHADINECELEMYPCHSNANCTDTDGSFNCTCRELLKSFCSFMNLKSTTVHQLGMLSLDNAVAFLKHTISVHSNYVTYLYDRYGWSSFHCCIDYCNLSDV